MVDQSKSVVLNLDALCTNQNQRETTKLMFDDDDIANTSVSELKVKIQNLISAPACDQKLSYLGQPLNNLEMKLGDLYIRHGDTLYVEYLEKAHIENMDSHIKMLKKFLASTSGLCTSDGNFVRVPSVNDVEKLEDFYADIAEPMEYLAYIFGKWKTVGVQANRHYFVQEEGLQCLIDIHAFSQKKYSWFNSDTSDNSPVLSIDDNDMETDGNEREHQIDNGQNDLFMRTDELTQTFNEWQLILNSLILRVLWNFMEEGPETQLVLHYGGLKLMIDAYLRSDEGDIQSHFAEDLSENALGCLCGCVEYDPHVQREVARNTAIMTKFINMIDVGLSLPRTYHRVQESCLVANTLFYMSFDQKALQTLIESGFHLRIMNSIQIVVEQELNVRKALIICYYCLLFLARVRSATLVSIPDEQGLAIDSYIKSFLHKGYSAKQIGDYEAKHVYVWITLAPIVHMIFAGGSFSNEEPCTDHDSPKDDIEVEEEEEILEEEDVEEEEGGVGGELAAEDQEIQEEDDGEIGEFEEEIRFYHHPSESSTRTLFSSAVHNECVHKEWDTEPNNVTTGIIQWPGSGMVQKLGIFALQHTLYSRDNLKLLISENLHSYLLCLLPQLKGKNRDRLARELMVITPSSMQVPSLKLLCKAVLARIKGFDAVRGW